jgi:serine/threonine-protein kinase
MIGELVGPYRIVKKLGEGGMGAVYLGEHLRIARKAAIKVLLPELSVNHQIVARFFSEARATSQIRHPGIVEILDSDVLPSGNAYIVMELLEGESLGDYLRGGRRLSVQRAASLTRSVADALAAAHEQGIVHRDLKPDNVFLLTGGSRAPIYPIKILDFGIAKLMHTGEGNYKTKTGSILGTPVYMSPEQCRGSGTIDHRTDIYSLGCMFFEMICGRPPFTSEGFGELIQSHLSVVPPALRSFDAAIPAAVDALGARLLAKSPADRPQNMAALIQELDAAMAGAPAASAERAEPVAAGFAPADAGTVRASPGARETPRIQTTLRTAASENLPVVDTSVFRPASKSRKTGAVILVGAALAAAVVGGTFLRRDVEPAPGATSAAAAPTSPGPSAANVVAAQPVEPETVSIDVSDAPPDLTLTVDGKPTRLPVVLPRGSGVHALTFQAPGFQDRTLKLDASLNRTVTLALQPKSPAIVPEPKESKRRPPSNRRSPPRTEPPAETPAIDRKL